MSKRKQRWVAHVAFEVEFEAVSPNKAMERGEILAHTLAGTVIDGLEVKRASGVMLAPLKDEEAA